MIHKGSNEFTTADLVDLAIKQAQDLNRFYFLDENNEPEDCDEVKFRLVMDIVNQHRPMKKYIKALVLHQGSQIKAKQQPPQSSKPILVKCDTDLICKWLFYLNI